MGSDLVAARKEERATEHDRRLSPWFVGGVARQDEGVGSDIARVHPLVDAIDGDVVVSRSDRAVVALTPLRADLLIAARGAERRVRLVTAPTYTGDSARVQSIERKSSDPVCTAAIARS